ncbi:MAG: hypothetical protein WBC19_02975 [Pyrinomonadaceae bacterium]|nr:hypothetical protein [Chloracidobacterium sp.]
MNKYKISVKSFLLLFFLYLLLFAGSSQTNGQTSYTWNGLTIGKSTRDEIIKRLGTPDNEQSATLSGYWTEWLGPSVQEKIWKTIDYNDKKYFLIKLGIDEKSEKLVYILLKPKALSPDLIFNAFDVPFQICTEFVSPKDFPKYLTGKLTVEVANVYTLVGFNSRLIAFVKIDQADEVRISPQIKTLGGNVTLIMLVSRGLESDAATKAFKKI